MKKFAYGCLAAVAFAAALANPVAAAMNRYDIRIINNASSSIVAVYARNLATDTLSGDILGAGIITVGDFKTIRLVDGDGTCHWRIQTDLADGREVRRNLNVCSTISLTITD